MRLGASGIKDNFRATDEVDGCRDEITYVCYCSLRSSRSVYALQVETTNQKWYKCWYCTNLSHRPDTCHKFVAVSINQHIKIAKENHVCFSCMKAAGREHQIDNCGRHRKCTNTDNGRECMHFHRLLLHKSTAV